MRFRTFDAGKHVRVDARLRKALSVKKNMQRSGLLLVEHGFGVTAHRS